MPKLIACAPPCRWISRTTSSGGRPGLLGDRDEVEPGPLGSRLVPRDPDRCSAVALVQPTLRSRAAARRRGPGRRRAGRTRCRPPWIGPVRHDHRRQLGARGDIRILVGRDALARPPAPRRSARAAPRDRAPVRLAAGLQVRDVHRDARALADGDRLVDRLEQPGAFVADVRGVNPAVPARRPGPARSARRFGIAAGNVDQAGGKPPGPRLACPARRAASSGPTRRASAGARHCPGWPIGRRRAGPGG